MAGKMGSPYRKFLLPLLLLLLICTGCTGREPGPTIEEPGKMPQLPFACREGEVAVLYRVSTETVRDPEDGTPCWRPGLLFPSWKTWRIQRVLPPLTATTKTLRKNTWPMRWGRGQIAQTEWDAAREDGFPFIPITTIRRRRSTQRQQPPFRPPDRL